MPAFIEEEGIRAGEGRQAAPASSGGRMLSSGDIEIDENASASILVSWPDVRPASGVPSNELSPEDCCEEGIELTSPFGTV